MHSVAYAGKTGIAALISVAFFIACGHLTQSLDKKTFLPYSQNYRKGDDKVCILIYS